MPCAHSVPCYIFREFLNAFSAGLTVHCVDLSILSIEVDLNV
jgi:hypothetical protein